MRIALLAPLIIAVPAGAADFRGTAFGGPCAAIPDREAALGSSLKDQQQTKADSHTITWFKFTGKAFQHDVEITYLCSDGQLNSGGYVFGQSTYDQALNDFLAAYGQLVAQLGPPLSQVEDGKSISPTLDLTTLEMPEPITYSASWASAGFYPNLSLLVDGGYEGAGWHVVYTFSKER